MAESRITALVLVGSTGDRRLTLLNCAQMYAGLAVIRWAPIGVTRQVLSYCSGATPRSRRLVRRELSKVSKSAMLQVAGSSVEWARTLVQVAPGTTSVPLDSPLPHLIIRGQGDAYSIPGWHSWVRRRRGARLCYVRVPRAGHLANLDNTEYFNDALLSFLGKLYVGPKFTKLRG
jgi:pimeloyl-ACP methyl ester carboxylesterase